MKPFLIIFYIIISIDVFTQIVNIENRRIYDDTTGLSGNFDASFSYIENKEYIYNLKLNSRLQYKTKKHYLLFLSDFFYSGGRTVYANSGLGHLRYAYRIANSTWKWESYSQIQYNQLLNQKVRAILGTGIRNKIIEKDKLKIFFGSSVFFEHEEIQPNNEYNNDFRWSNYLSWFIPIKKISFTGTTYYQPMIGDFHDYRFSGQYAINSIISRKFRLKMEYFIFFDSNPPTGVRSRISSLLFGFGIDF
jgi:hypothetical protein